MQEQIITILPIKSTLWISGNIAAGIIFVTFLTRIIGGFIFSSLVAGNIILQIIFSVLFLLVGIYLGTNFGVGYVVRRTQIDPQKIDKIGTTTAMFPFAFFLLFLILDIFVAFSSGEEFKFPLDSLIALLLSIPIVIFLVRRFLKQKVGNS